MVYEIATGYTYIPKWKNNKEKPEVKQIKLNMKYASGARQSSLYNKLGLTVEDIENKTEKYFIYDFCTICESVENLEVSENGKVRQATPKDIASEQIFDSLYSEVKVDYINRTEVKPKN